MAYELQALHVQLRQMIAELAVLVSQASPDIDALSSTRLKLTRLSGRRQSMIQCAILPRLHAIPPANAAQLQDLRLEAAALAVKFSEHISRWTTRAIQSDWPGYQRASAEMRRSMLNRIEREAAILYPLLEAERRAHA